MARSKALRLVGETYGLLREHHPNAHCELDHDGPFQLVVATVLSAQTTDVLVNKVTPDLFARYPDPERLAQADLLEVQQVLSRMGMFRQKAKNIVGLAGRLIAEHDGQVPETLSELVALPGVGRKTANVVLGVAFAKPAGVVVDTHVMRISQRLGWTKNTGPVEIEEDLMSLFERQHWDMLSHTLIFHGRRVCTARKPACASCPLAADHCPNAFDAELVGRRKRTTDSSASTKTAKKKKVAKKATKKKTAVKKTAKKKTAAKKVGKKKTAAR